MISLNFFLNQNHFLQVLLVLIVDAVEECLQHLFIYWDFDGSYILMLLSDDFFNLLLDYETANY